MSDRITRKQVESLFVIFCNEYQFPISKGYKEPGLSLDYIGCYGGYVVQQSNTDNGGIAHPFGHTRRSTRDMWDALQFALRLGEAKRLDKSLTRNAMDNIPEDIKSILYPIS